MSTVKKSKIEKIVESLKEEGNQLLQEKQSTLQKLKLIDARLTEIQGGINVLLPLLEEKPKTS